MKSQTASQTTLFWSRFGDTASLCTGRVVATQLGTGLYGTGEGYGLVMKADLCFSAKIAVYVFIGETWNVLQTIVCYKLAESVGAMI